MKLAALLLLALPIWSQAVPAPPAPNTANTAIPVTLPPDVVKAIQAALAAAQASATPAPPAVSPSTCPGEASQFFSVGGGVNGIGPAQFFGYFSTSQHVACGTWTTEISEFARMPGGLVGNSTRAGISKSLWTLGNLNVGIVGDVGAAEGATGSLSGALAARVYGVLRLGKSSWHIVATAEDLKIAGTGSQTVISLGIGFGVYK